MKRPAQLVFIPAPGAGHIVSTVEIAKQLVARDDQLFITILIMKLPFDKLFINTDPSISHRISFINLPESHIDTQGLAFPSFIKTFVQGHKTHVKDAVTKLLAESAQVELAGFVIDMFCTPMINVADEFQIPSYLFFTSSAASLGFSFHLQSLHDEQGKDVAEITGWDSELVVPSFINPVPAGVWPGVTRTKEGAIASIDFAARFRQTKGILINTFRELEPHALRSLSDGKIPPVYPVGPLLNLKSDDGHVGTDQSIQKSDILEWLDDQPPSSVVFLCFGSMGSFDEAQVKEIACALEQSGQRFLWSLRQPKPKGKMGMPSDYVDVKLVLPEGFLDRTARIGKVIGWAPQVAILAHPAVGGFVSHCGWNSTLESLWCGVPIATWPMYAEQQLNAFGLVKELGLGVEIKMDYKQDSEVVVSAEDIERGIRQVMEKDSDIRARVKEISEKSKKALTDGGSSYSSLGRFLDQI
ncbi:PREDICTED: UDP-glycosyltransferase 71A16-like [Prunus mume]|uniref:Glycosyltransferase n=1 Tax=Prunus mume TaxID=102107 RepID=A0ABM0NTL7_PRUMU|nr:PREDICTED: UDP-glycosyltransferase 71A16-like [Prunus mume]